MSSSNNSNNNFDCSSLPSTMGRFQLHPPYLNTNSHLSQNLDDFLLTSNNNNISTHKENKDDYKTYLIKEESKIEKEIIRIILSGKIETLKPNSGQAIIINEHQICVCLNEEIDPNCRVWEWHGHIVTFQEEKGYTLEYVSGNYFERKLTMPFENEDEFEVEEENGWNLGLRGLIGSVDSFGGRILGRNLTMNTGSRRL